MAENKNAAKKPAGIPGTAILKALVRDPVSKLGCLLLATMLWMYVVGEEKIQFEFRDVPVRFLNLAADLGVQEGGMRSVTLRVSGPKATAGGLKPADFEVRVDVSGKRRGMILIPLSLDNVVSPRSDVKVERIDPPSLRVVLEPVDRKYIMIEPRLQGEPPPGYTVEASAVPDSAMVIGPISVFSSFSTLHTEVVDVTNRVGPFIEKVRIAQPSASILTIDPEVVSVRINVTEIMTERRFDGVPVGVQGGPAGGVLINPESLSVTLLGPQNIINRMNPEEIKILVQTPEGKPFHLSVPRAINLPEKIQVVRFDPQMVRVSLSEP